MSPLVEAALEEHMGWRNYWRRWTCLKKFDAWYYDFERSAWRERWKQNQAVKIKTPEQFLNVLLALTKFVSEQMGKDPNYRPPEKFMEIIAKVRPLIQQAIASREGTAAGDASAVAAAG